MSDWHKIIDKETKEEQIVSSLEGIDLEKYDVVACPDYDPAAEFQKVEDDGTVCIDQARKDCSDRCAQLRTMQGDQLYEYILSLESRIATLEGKVG